MEESLHSSRLVDMQKEMVPVQETCPLGLFNLPVQETSNIFSKADLIKNASLKISNENIKYAKQMEFREETSLVSTTNQMEHQDTEKDIYQAENVNVDHLATDKEVKHQCMAESGSKGENDAVGKLSDTETEGIQFPDTVEDEVTENLLEMPDKETSHSDTGHQEGSLEKVSEFGPEDITESEVVVDGSQSKKNYDTGLEDEGTKQIPDITEEKTQKGDSDKMLGSHGEDMGHQDHATCDSDKEKVYPEKISSTGCENLVTEEVEKHKENPVLAANAKNQKKNGLENKPSKGMKFQVSANDKETHSDTGENKHQEGTLEKVSDFGHEDIKESAVVVDGEQLEKNNYKEMLHLEDIDITEVKAQLGNSDSDKMLVIPGEDMEQHHHAIGESYKEKAYSENNSSTGCENLYCLVTAKAKSEKKNDLEYKSSKGIKFQESSDDKENEARSDPGENKYQEGTLEKVSDFGLEDIMESETVVNRNQHKENCDERTKEIPDITEEKAQLGNSDSEKMLVGHGEDMEPQDHVKGECYREKMYSEKISSSGCESLVTEIVKKQRENLVLAANATNEKKNDLKNKSSKGKNRKASAIDKGNKAHSDSEKLAAPNASHQMMPTLKMFARGIFILIIWGNFLLTEAFPVNPIWQEYWVNGTNLLAQVLKIHNLTTSCSLTFATSQVYKCSDSSFAVLCSNTSLWLLVMEPLVKTWYLEYGSCAACQGTTEVFVSGGQFNDTQAVMKILQKYTSQPVIRSLQQNSTNISAAPGSDAPVWLMGLCLLVFLAAPTTFCFIIRCFCVKTQTKNENFVHHSTAPERVMVDGREESHLDIGEFHALTSENAAET